MVPVQNYDIYFPVQVWASSDGSTFRFQPPLLGFRDEYRFSPRFWDSLEVTAEEAVRMETTWTLTTTFWAFNPKYALYLNRGMTTMVILQNTSFPFQSLTAYPFRSSLAVFGTMDIFLHSFGFGVYNYAVPGTSLLYLRLVLFRLEIEKVLLCPNHECPVLPDYNFLPNRHNNDTVSSSDILTHDTNFFLFVFPSRPTGQYFRLTSQGLCVPSDRPKDFNCFYDCMRHGAESRVVPTNIYTGSTIPELQQVMYSFPTDPHVNRPYAMLWLPLTLFLLVSIVVLFALLRPVSRRPR